MAFGGGTYSHSQMDWRDMGGINFGPLTVVFDGVKDGINKIHLSGFGANLDPSFLDFSNFDCHFSGLWCDAVNSYSLTWENSYGWDRDIMDYRNFDHFWILNLEYNEFQKSGYNECVVTAQYVHKLFWKIYGNIGPALHLTPSSTTESITTFNNLKCGVFIDLN